MGISVSDLRQHIIKPCLIEAGLWSLAAENLIVGIGLVESNFSYVKQIGGIANGGLGVFQMEKLTHDDLVKYVSSRPITEKAILAASNTKEFDSNSLVYNLRYATLMTRLFFLRDPNPLPDAKNYGAMTELHKRRYNTVLGDTDTFKSVLLFKKACE